MYGELADTTVFGLFLYLEKIRTWTRKYHINGEQEADTTKICDLEARVFFVK